LKERALSRWGRERELVFAANLRRKIKARQIREKKGKTAGNSKD